MTVNELVVGGLAEVSLCHCLGTVTNYRFHFIPFLQTMKLRLFKVLLIFQGHTAGIWWRKKSELVCLSTESVSY